MKKRTKRSMERYEAVQSFNKRWEAKKEKLARAGADMMKKPFGKVLGYMMGGIPVFTVEGSHLHKAAEPFIADAISSITPKGFVRTVVKFDKPIGVTYCVPVTDKDTFKEEVRCFGPDRKPRPYASRIVMGRKPEPTNELTVIAAPMGQAYCLYTTWVGGLAPREVPDLEFAVANCKPEDKPQLEKDLAEAKAFWAEHALTEDALND